jgi:hypothetical protein
LAVTLAVTAPTVAQTEFFYRFSTDGGASVPVSPGSYAIALTVTQPGYTGSASGTLVVSQGSQTIAFAAPAPVAVGAQSFDLAATSSSGLPVAFTSSDASVATVSGSTVTVVCAGTTTITATQAGDGNYLAAAPVRRDLVVNLATVAVPATPAWALLGALLVLVAGCTCGYRDGAELAGWDGIDDV